MADIIYTWRTSKVSNGFQYRVIKITPKSKADKRGFFARTQVIKIGIMPTRARAKAQAQRWVRFFKLRR